MMNNTYITAAGNCSLLSLLQCSDGLINAAVAVTFSAVGLIFGVPVNIYILQMILSRNLIASDFFAFNHAICEILIYQQCAVVLVLYSTDQNSVMYVQSVFLGLMLTGRPMFLACMCVERYLAVVKPVVFLRLKPLRYRVAFSGTVWVLTVASCLASWFLASDYDRMCLVQIAVLCGVKLYCCVMTLYTLKRPGPGEGNRKKEETSSMKLKAFMIILVITISVIFIYLPTLVAILVKIHLPESQFLKTLGISQFINTFAGFVQPLIYLLRSGKLPCIKWL